VLERARIFAIGTVKQRDLAGSFAQHHVDMAAAVFTVSTDRDHQRHVFVVGEDDHALLLWSRSG
jgi:hypothetical protein